MNNPFNKNNDIEFYNIKPTNYEEKKLICIPFYCYKVYAPKPVKSQLNIFQKVILTLYQSKRLFVDELNEHTGLDKELIRLIISELLNYNYLDTNYKITEKGEKALEKEETVINDIENDEYTYGYVYQNPFNLKFSPFFNTVQKNVEIVNYNNEGYPIIDFGTKGEPNKKTPFILFPQEIKQAVTPSAEEIIEIVKKHKRILNNIEDGNNIEPEYYINKLGKVSTINDEPENIYLATYIYSSIENKTGEWKIFDPFGIKSNNLELKDLINNFFSKQQVFKDLIDKLLNRYEQRKQFEKEKAYKIEYNDAKIEVENRLGSDFSDNQLFHLFIEIEKNFIRKDYSKISIEAQKIAESVFSEIWENNKEIIKRIKVSNDREINRVKINTFLTKKIGIESPQKIIVDVRQIRYYLKKGDGSLRAKVAGALLSAIDNENFILNKMLSEDKNLLEKLDNIAEIRNKDAHASKENNTDNSELLNIREDIYQFIKLYIKNI